MDDREIWVRFAAASMAGMSANQDTCDRLTRTELAEATASNADALLAEYRNRYPAPERDEETALVWEDTRRIIFDDGIVFSEFWDSFGWNHLRQETVGPDGALYAVWPEGEQWSAYGGHDEAMAYRQFASEAEAKAAVARWIAARDPARDRQTIALRQWQGREAFGHVSHADETQLDGAAPKPTCATCGGSGLGEERGRCRGCGRYDAQKGEVRCGFCAGTGWLRWPDCAGESGGSGA